jgi:hypothetical protein
MANIPINPQQTFTECNDRLDIMVTNLAMIAEKQGATALGAVDLVKMRNTYSQQISDFMIYYLAATAVLRLVNLELDRSRHGTDSD